MNTSNKKVITSKRDTKGEARVIFTADDFGLSKEQNSAIIDGLTNGALTSTCVCANGDFFDIPPTCELGVHLNIIEGKSLLPHQHLTRNGEFCHSFISLLINSKKLECEIEAEFRAQIERVLECCEVTHINSHVHTHAIPAIFEITTKLAAEYKIPFIRTQAEKIYFSDTLPKPINLMKVALLNYFTIINRPVVKKYNLKTNDYVIGIGYTGQMDENKLLDGLKALSHFNNITVEIIVHPSTLGERVKEYELCKNSSLKEKIEELGCKLY